MTRRRILLALLLASLLFAQTGAPSAGAAPPSTLAGRWSWPLPAPHRVVTDFEAPSEVWSPGHRGIDVSAAPGAVVVAPESGVVHFTGTVVDRPVLSLEHPGGLLSSFEPVTALVKKGEVVQTGQVIGVLGVDHCDGVSCLHIGARVDGVYLSPLLLLGELWPAILLPTRPIP